MVSDNPQLIISKDTCEQFEYIGKINITKIRAVCGTFMLIFWNALFGVLAWHHGSKHEKNKWCHRIVSLSQKIPTVFMILWFSCLNSATDIPPESEENEGHIGRNSSGPSLNEADSTDQPGSDPGLSNRATISLFLILAYFPLFVFEF